MSVPGALAVGQAVEAGGRRHWVAYLGGSVALLKGDDGEVRMYFYHEIDAVTD